MSGFREFEKEQTPMIPSVEFEQHYKDTEIVIGLVGAVGTELDKVS